MAVLRLLLTLLLVAAVAMPALAQDKPRSGCELVFPVPSEPPSYDGHREETFGLIHPFAPFYNTLLRVDPNDPSGTKPVASLAEKWTGTGIDLHGGLAGVALCLDHFATATGDPALREAAGRAVELMAQRLGEEDSVAEVSGGAHPYAGLMRGSSGPALAFIRFYERTGEAGLLDLAAVALRQDLRRCVIQTASDVHTMPNNSVTTRHTANDGKFSTLARSARISGVSSSLGQLYWMFWRVEKWP